MSHHDIGQIILHCHSRWGLCLLLDKEASTSLSTIKNLKFDTFLLKSLISLVFYTHTFLPLVSFFATLFSTLVFFLKYGMEVMLILGFKQLFVNLSHLQWGVSVVLFASYLPFPSSPGVTHCTVHTHRFQCHIQACGSCDTCVAMKINTEVDAQNLNETRQWT